MIDRYKEMNVNELGKELKGIRALYDDIYKDVIEIDKQYDSLEDKDSKEAYELADLSQSLHCSLESLIKKENYICKLIAINDKVV